MPVKAYGLRMDHRAARFTGKMITVTGIRALARNVGFWVENQLVSRKLKNGDMRLGDRFVGDVKIEQ
ncbi:hypothetical protein [Cycloclasticus pugetii]|uniref:hypothetical protein n=1 Tax=Cycloclasticus pugetii TaxID=34068 RepID=UPI003A8E5BE5